jgi:hypothetical protein
MVIQACSLLKPTCNQTNLESYALTIKAWFTLKHPIRCIKKLIKCGINEHPSLDSFDGINLQFHWSTPTRIMTNIDVCEIFIINNVKWPQKWFKRQLITSSIIFKTNWILSYMTQLLTTEYFSWNHNIMKVNQWWTQWRCRSLVF